MGLGPQGHSEPPVSRPGYACHNNGRLLRAAGHVAGAKRGRTEGYPTSTSRLGRAGRPRWIYPCRLAAPSNRRRFVPYVVMHEFEGLLFSDPDRFARGYGNARSYLPSYRQSATSFGTPEEINDTPENPPFRGGCVDLYEGYRKALDGRPGRRGDRSRRHSRGVSTLRQMGGEARAEGWAVTSSIKLTDALTPNISHQAAPPLYIPAFGDLCVTYRTRRCRGLLTRPP